jgi:hypothetical protein
MRFKVISGIRPSFPGLSRSGGQVTHVLLTRSPLVYPEGALPLDLHVLSTPPAFVLSQDQTLQQKTLEQNSPSKKHPTPLANKGRTHSKKPVTTPEDKPRVPTGKKPTKHSAHC